MADIPEGEFYSRLYVDPGPPQVDSGRFRKRLAAFFAVMVGRVEYRPLVFDIATETGYDKVDLAYPANFSQGMAAVRPPGFQRGELALSGG